MWPNDVCSVHIAIVQASGVYGANRETSCIIDEYHTDI